jgi:hypothetical protein
LLAVCYLEQQLQNSMLMAMINLALTMTNCLSSVNSWSMSFGKLK